MPIQFDKSHLLLDLRLFQEGDWAKNPKARIGKGIWAKVSFKYPR